MYRRTELDNGVKIISETVDYLHSVSLGIWVNTGSRDENRKENGISHFIEHMVFKGTKSRSSLQIAKELDAIGGQSNAFTGRENICIHARVLGKHFSCLSDILCDIFLRSTFSDEDVNRERQVILQEISMVEDTPDDNIHDLFHRFFWMDHPIGMPVQGTGETVSAFAQDDILRYMDKFYAPERIAVVAAGNVEHESLVSHFGPLFGSLKAGRGPIKRMAPDGRGGISVHHKELEQVHVCLGGEAPALKSEERFSCAILNTILGGNMSSRLFQEIRENLGLAYAVYSFHSPYIDAGLLGVYVATDPLKVNTVLEAIRKEVKKIKSGNLSDPDLAAAKEYIVGGIHLASENPDNLMVRMARNQFVFGRYVSTEEVVRSLEGVSVDDVVEVAGDIFRAGKVSLTALGMLNEEDLDMRHLDFD